MILAGRFGAVKYDEAATLPVKVASINAFKLSWKTQKIKVTCFGDANEVYVPGLPDVQGTISGFWNSDELTLFQAASAEVPGLLELVPNENEPLFVFKGTAYLDADIDTKVDGAPSVSGTFMAAGPWTQPTGTVLARGPAEKRAA